jgi:hypothetical protein
MTDIDRNMRTLIVCFVLAIMVLVPLKVMSQDGSQSLSIRQAEVLGETSDDGVKMEVIYGDEQGNEVVLPDAEVPVVVETEE